MGYTTRPSATFWYRFKMPSTARKASGTLMRLLAESSRVRSNHWVAMVMAGFTASAMTYRAKEAMRSLRMGLRL